MNRVADDKSLMFLKLQFLRKPMAIIETLMNFWNQYWWAIIIAVIIVIIAILVRTGMMGARLRSLFEWPPAP
jgi:hypothetical protein